MMTAEHRAFCDYVRQRASELSRLRDRAVTLAEEDEFERGCTDLVAEVTDFLIREIGPC